MHYFDTDASTYFVDGKIIINATYDMFYDPFIEEMYFQVQIYNSTNDLIWNSLIYNMSDNYIETWIVNISELYLSNEYSNILYVRFFVHWYQKSSFEFFDSFLREKQVQIIKKEVSCQLIGFKDRLKIGNNLTFKARFFDNILGNSMNLINQSVQFKVENNGKLIFNGNYTINSSGMIDIKVCSSTNLKIGQNIMIFEFENNKYYNDSSFYYDVLVEEILSYNDIPWLLNAFSFASIVVITSIIIIIISNINKNTKQRSLSEITFRY